MAAAAAAGVPGLAYVVDTEAKIPRIATGLSQVINVAIFLYFLQRK